MTDQALDPERPITPELARVLVEQHRDFLRFVERRVHDRALAEEIVQDAFVRSLDRGDQIQESVVGWFYRVLRNAVVDHQRRRASASRRLDSFAAEPDASQGDAELERVACACVTELAGTLKSEYADALAQIDVRGVAVKDYANAVGISPNSAGVRIFRARAALRQRVARACGTCATHGCLDCTCDAPGHRGEAR